MKKPVNLLFVALFLSARLHPGAEGYSMRVPSPTSRAMRNRSVHNRCGQNLRRRSALPERKSYEEGYARMIAYAKAKNDFVGRRRDAQVADGWRDVGRVRERDRTIIFSLSLISIPGKTTGVADQLMRAQCRYNIRSIHPPAVSPLGEQPSAGNFLPIRYPLPVDNTLRCPNKSRRPRVCCRSQPCLRRSFPRSLQSF